MLLDMNGTICYRNEEPVPGVRHAVHIRHKFFYRRFGVENFCQKLQKSGKYDVCIYSSMMEHNIEAGLNAILPPDVRRNLRAILDREMNKPDPNGLNEWDTVRDMKKVWKKLPGYGPKRTILLDNEARKFGDAAANGIVVPEFGPAEIKSRKTNTLDSLLVYLLNLADEDPEDVREYMEENPFDATAPAIRRKVPITAAAATSMGEKAQLKREEEPNLDELETILNSMSLKTRPKTNTRVDEADASVAKSTHTSSTDIGRNIPKGTDLRLTNISNGKFIMSNFTHHVEVRGPVSNLLDIQSKMDFHRLLNEATQAGIDLEVKTEETHEWEPVEGSVW